MFPICNIYHKHSGPLWVFFQQMVISTEDITYTCNLDHMDANHQCKLLGDAGEQRKRIVFKNNDVEQGKTSGISLPHKGAVPSDLRLTTPN